MVWKKRNQPLDLDEALDKAMQTMVLEMRRRVNTRKYNVKEVVSVFECAQKYLQLRRGPAKSAKEGSEIDAIRKKLKDGGSTGGRGDGGAGSSTDPVRQEYPAFPPGLEPRGRVISGRSFAAPKHDKPADSSGASGGSDASEREAAPIVVNIGRGPSVGLGGSGHLRDDDEDGDGGAA